MQYRRLYTLQTWLRRLFFLMLVAVLVVTGVSFQRGTLSLDRVGRVLGQVTRLPGLPQWQVAIIAGHRGNDTGAVCKDGLMEVQITEAVANRVAKLLQNQGAQVRVLDEYDKRLDGLQADALLSIHADSCIPLTGYKVASAAETVIPEQDNRLETCIEEKYGEVTGLPLHPSTVTKDMTEYHAFQQVADTTPGAIIELGFLGGDRDILVNGQAKLAQGIADGLVCYLETRPKATTTPGESTSFLKPEATPNPG
jgi:N-acetylmuramoyl-L-alanine amidase